MIANPYLFKKIGIGNHNVTIVWMINNFYVKKDDKLFAMKLFLAF